MVPEGKEKSYGGNEESLVENLLIKVWPEYRKPAYNDEAPDNSNTGESQVGQLWNPDLQL